MFAGLESPTHILLLLVVIVLLFGAKRLPEMGRSLGKGIQEFKEGLNTKEESKEAEGKHPEALEEKRSEFQSRGVA
jgi:sec-independent protein translocase protein TatA